MSNKVPMVNYLDQTESLECPYGTVSRVITGGEGGVANVHVVEVTQGGAHYHSGYDEVYYVLAGQGTISIDGTNHALRPGASVVIPANCRHSLQADPGQRLAFVIFGTPAMSADDDRFIPRSEKG